MQERWNALEAEAAAARQEAEEARAAAGKADADLAALSTAYNDLEEHAFKMEEQLKQQEQVQQQQGPAAAAGGVPESEMQARIQAALEQVGGSWLDAG
jgi:4-diphosphocytidyl-2C-methyl-D-erythritol kinase